MVALYKENGYDGIFITDHFVNGSTRTEPHMSWEEKMDIFTLGYRNALAAGKEVGLDVFFGIEYNCEATEVLIYGLDAEWLYSHPDCDKLGVREISALAHESEAFVVHAHPFRVRSYIPHIRLYPDCVDAVEVLNASHYPDTSFDRRAEWYADEYGLAKTAGSDNHHLGQSHLGGILTDKKIASALDYAEIIREGRAERFIKLALHHTESK